MTIQQFVVRLAPITSTPLLVDAMSLRDGQLKAIVGNETKTIGIDYFRASEPVTQDFAHKIVQEYAKTHNIDEHTVMVRARLPKSNIAPRKPRATNDAHLVLAKTDKPVPEQKKVEKKSDDLTNMAQALQDAHDKQKVSAGNRESTTVKRTEEEKKRRKYTKKPAAERSAKSKAAYDRYVKELSQQVAANPSMMEPVAANATPEVVNEAVMELAKALARILKVPGAL